tara:strand:- start:398 stop:895 length:498 start_codon:yes stop_codon:yes gene_type:complete
MPNHCLNRVTFYAHHSDSGDSEKQIAKLKEIFEGESIFPQIIPEPDWLNEPLMSKDVKEYSFSKPRGKVGELPVMTKTSYGMSSRFPSTGIADDRWYDWRIQNWDTKWDAYDVEILDDDPENFEVMFNTAWSPPEAICNQIREDYPDVSVSWFYDEPGCEIAGYL